MSKPPSAHVQQEITESAHIASKMDIDVNLPNSSNDGRCCKRTVVQPAKEMKRSEYLQVARHKYYWNDPSMPAWRFSEDEDDNGKTIEELELFRPLEMDDITYQKRIEEAILYWELREVEEEKTCESPNEPKPSTTAQKGNSSGGECEMSIQCAQKEPAATGLTNSPKCNHVSNNHFIDLKIGFA